MPKIRDLGINVIPETMRPPEVGPGGGGGGGGCQYGSMGCGIFTGQCPTTSPGTGFIAWGQTPPCPTTSPGTTTGYYMQGQTVPCPTTSPGTTTGYYVQGQTGPCPTTSPGTTTGYYMQGQTGQCPTTSPTFTTACPAYSRMDCPTTSPGQPSTPPDCQLTRDAIQQLKQQLQRQIEQLDEYAKSIGPKTIAEITEREKVLQAELEELAKRRKEYERSE